jgi:3-hydroxypropionate dehydrogenase (NADP+)
MTSSIKNIGCIGVGTIGHSWATLFATKGYSVAIYDTNQELCKVAVERTKGALNFLTDKGLISPTDAKDSVNRIRIVDRMAECTENADYVQESAFESYDIKKKIFSDVDKINDRAILATSTSGLLMTEIQKATQKPERCIVAHPWNPPLLLKLVELVPGQRTSEETTKATFEFMEALGKIPVIVRKEVPGFIGNRLQAAIWREALNLVNTGVASIEDVDKAVWAGPGARWAIMGPFLTFHLGGGPKGLRHHIETIQNSFSEYWKSMDDWKDLPYHAAKKAMEDIEQLPSIRGKSFQDLVRWRDELLVGILRVQELNAKGKCQLDDNRQ